MNERCQAGCLPTCGNMNAGLQPHTDTKINSRWTVDVDVRGKAIECTEYTRREYLHDPGIGNDSLSKNKTTSTSKEKNGKLSYLNIKHFVPRHHSKNEKSSHRVGESICNTFNGQRALYADYRKNQKLIFKRQLNRKMGKRFKQAFHKRCPNDP